MWLPAPLSSTMPSRLSGYFSKSPNSQEEFEMDQSISNRQKGQRCVTFYLLIFRAKARRSALPREAM